MREAVLLTASEPHDARPLWVLERSGSERFPFRLRILRNEKPWLTLRVQDRWPGAGQHIFCLRETEPPEPWEIFDELERVRVLALEVRGRRTSVVLDRSRNRRCDFLFLTRRYKNRPDDPPYEQIYWLTQAAMQQRRPRARLVSVGAPQPYRVRIASDERYPWRFPASDVERGRLLCGDYALMDDDSPLAVVERKTFDNFLADIGVMPVLHQRLAELAAQEHHALVVEAPYEDFLNPKKLRYYSATFCAAAIADLYAAHSGVRIVFCANRKTANEWTRNFFAAVWRSREETRETINLASGRGRAHALDEVAESTEPYVS